jgi:hypothetical protein
VFSSLEKLEGQAGSLQQQLGTDRTGQKEMSERHDRESIQLISSYTRWSTGFVTEDVERKKLEVQPSISILESLGFKYSN